MEMTILTYVVLNITSLCTSALLHKTEVIDAIVTLYKNRLNTIGKAELLGICLGLPIGLTVNILTYVYIPHWVLMPIYAGVISLHIVLIIKKK